VFRVFNDHRKSAPGGKRLISDLFRSTDLQTQLCDRGDWLAEIIL